MFTPDLLAIAPAHVEAMRTIGSGERLARGIQTANAVGLVELTGPLDKSALVVARDQVNSLAQNPRVAEILILVDSPGGSVAGTHDLFLAISRAAAKKRVTAIAEDLAASAALYAIAGASEIVVNATGLVGSIGVFAVLVDASRLLQKAGIDVLVIRSGIHKGVGQWGAKLSPEHVQQIQSLVDAQASHFLAAVAKGRGLKLARVKDLADGRVLVGQQAVAAGLVDRIATLDEVLSEAATRQRHRQYEDLDPFRATAKFNELVELWQMKRYERPVADCSPSMRSSAEAAIGERYPYLAATVRELAASERAKKEDAKMKKDLRIY